jgi:hypothetical protein
VRIIKNNAVDRIPSPRTAGMMTQHKNSKKLSSDIVTRHFSLVCASEILLVTLFVTLGHLSNSATGTFFRFCHAALPTETFAHLKLLKQSRGITKVIGASKCFTLPADRLSKLGTSFLKLPRDRTVYVTRSSPVRYVSTLT